MNENQDLPSTYSAFGILELCSNRLVNVRVPISVGNIPAFLLGRNSVPLVWLSAPEVPKGRRWRFVVEESRALYPGIDVRVDPSSRSVSVNVGSQKVLHASQTAEDMAVVDLIDLRPLGLNVHGTERGLEVRGLVLTGNTFSGLVTALAIGGD
jgi:hypothetical protein